MMAVKLLVKIAVMMMATAAFRRHRKRRGEGAPSSSSSLTSSLDGKRVSTLVLGSHAVGGVRDPPRLDLSLCLSLFLRSLILPLHCFFYIRRSVTPIGVNRGGKWSRIIRNIRFSYSRKCLFVSETSTSEPKWKWKLSVSEFI